MSARTTYLPLMAMGGASLLACSAAIGCSAPEFKSVGAQDAGSDAALEAQADASVAPKLLYHRVLPAGADLKVTGVDFSPLSENLLVTGYDDKISYLVELTDSSAAEVNRWTLTATNRVVSFGVAAGTNGEFFLCGGFGGTLSVEGEQAVLPGGSFAAFVTRIAPLEKKTNLWANGGPGTQQFESCTLHGGGVVSAGTFRNDTTVHQTTVTADSDGDGVLSTEYTGNDGVGWLKGTGRQVLFSVRPTKSGDVLVAGEADVTDMTSVLGSGVGSQAAVLGRFNAQLQPIWVHAFGSAFIDVVWQAVEDPTTGDIYAVGHANGPVDLGGGHNLPSMGGEDAFIVRFDAQGKLLGSRALAGSANERATSVVVRDDGGVVVVGTTLSPDLDLGTGPLSRSGPQDVFVVGLTHDLAPQWGFLAGSLGEDGLAVATGQGKRVALAGRFQGTFDFLGTSIDSGAQVGSADYGIVTFVFEP